MNKVLLQLWEESNINNEQLTNGCSLHLDKNERDKYVVSCIISGEIPNNYDRTIGDAVDVFIIDSLYEKLSNLKSIKLDEASFQNMINLEDIIYNEQTI